MDDDQKAVELQQPTPVNKTSVLLNLEDMIRSHLSSISRLEAELGKQKEMLDDVFENDSTFKEHSEKAKEAVRIKSATKQQILRQPQVASLYEKVRGMHSELKELRLALSDYLQQYQQMSGIFEIEDETGQIRQIIYVAKLVKKA